MHRRLMLCLFVFAASPLCASAQTQKEALVVFKDGFTVKGRLIQKLTGLYDPATGASFAIPANGATVYLDDDVRRIFFSPNQTQEAIFTKEGETRRDLMQIVKQPAKVRSKFILPGWVFEKIGEWNEDWHRNIKVNTQRGFLNIQQRIIKLTPWQTYIMTMDYRWDPQFRTKELGPEFVLKLLTQHYEKAKEAEKLKDYEKKLEMARFMEQAEWYGIALNMLEAIIKEHPESKKIAEPRLQNLRALRANYLADDIERTHRVGQHQEAQARIEAFYRDKGNEAASQQRKLTVQDIKGKYESANEKIAQAQEYLKALPAKLDIDVRPFWAIAAQTILEELTIDSVPRLDTFLAFAKQHLRELNAKTKPGQTTEEVLALAVSGWLQDNALAEPDVKNATRLFRARLMLREYLKTDTEFGRSKVLANFSKEYEVSPDVMGRLIRLMPPVDPPDNVTPKAPVEMSIQLPDSLGGSYIVQVPPDYNPHRPYPVLMALHTSREKPMNMVERMRELTFHHGYILVAPLWPEKKGLRMTYNYSAREHALVLDTLRDVRRRFNVDSDRVFLFGWEDGGTMAFDVGLAHPDQFAGVLPMNGNCAKYAEHYASNAQYLPFYVVEGDFNGANVGMTRKVVKDGPSAWVKSHYPAIYVEYKNRASEWYNEELISMMEWMNKKKRYHPSRSLGRANTTGGPAEGFCTLRTTDNKFYFLSTDSIDPRFVAEPDELTKTTRPAVLQASIAVGNEAGGKQALIWSQINVRTVGIKQVTVWLAPNMIDFTKPVLVRINGNQIGQPRVVPPNLATLLEEFNHSGDRQRLYYAKMELGGER
jgi:pimeloyl-ACP methyl ester carboxylesterase